jgi:hypothetical protein
MSYTYRTNITQTLDMLQQIGYAAKDAAYKLHGVLFLEDLE